MVEELGNIIYVDDVTRGDMYIPEENVVNERFALTADGSVKAGYFKLETKFGATIYASNDFYRTWATTDYDIVGGWYDAESREPWEMIEDLEPLYYGNLVMKHLDTGSYQVTDSTIYFID